MGNVNVYVAELGANTENFPDGWTALELDADEFDVEIEHKKHEFKEDCAFLGFKAIFPVDMKFSKDAHRRLKEAAVHA